MTTKKELTKDYSVIGITLIGAKVIDIFVSRNIEAEWLTVIFKKGKEQGILIFAYNDLGGWLEYLEVGEKIIIPISTYFDSEEVDRVNQLVREFHDTLGDVE